ncbi:MGMT family protein [candidate division WOR-3 bacterium]|nr:MGMT family protein [candidate division WOR-3 bacterium]
MAKSWREKRDKPQEPMVVKIEGKMIDRFGPGRMIIATPKIIDGMVRKVPEGKLATVNQIMDRLCEEYKTDAACPMTTGIFLNIVAKAAEEERAAGVSKIAPYWRVLKTKGALNPKYPGGMEAQAERLEQEGHAIDKTRKTWKVADFEKRLVKGI